MSKALRNVSRPVSPMAVMVGLVLIRSSYCAIWASVDLSAS